MSRRRGARCHGVQSLTASSASVERKEGYQWCLGQTRRVMVEHAASGGQETLARTVTMAMDTCNADDRDDVVAVDVLHHIHDTRMPVDHLVR